MILLNLQLALQGDLPQPAITASPYLGGVLHGAFEHLVRLHTPEVAVELGMVEGSQQKYYAIYPPPYGWQAETDQTPLYLGCGVMLFGHVTRHAEQLIPVLQHWEEIRLAGLSDKVQSVQIYSCIPGDQPRLRTGSQAESVWHQVAPSFDQVFTECSGVTLDWLTPLTLASEGHRRAGVADAAPTLLRLVRSLVRRIQALEPALATFLGLGSSVWIEAEESIRHAPAEVHTLESVPWQYGSRTKESPILLNGLIGQITYRGSIPAPIMALLHWGSWFGAGQRTTLGHGMYSIKEIIA